MEYYKFNRNESRNGSNRKKNFKIFQHMPNLLYLTLETCDLCLDGYSCEIIITDYLPHIKKFQLKMSFELYFDLTNEKYMYEQH